MSEDSGIPGPYRGYRVAAYMKAGQALSSLAIANYLEARGGIEPPIKVLQTFALPLGDRASYATILLQVENPASPHPFETAMPGAPGLRDTQLTEQSAHHSSFSPN